jgi:nucleotide-binding universal stress UspA family protein
MTLKTIVVFVDFSTAGEARTRYAVKLAYQHGAHLIGVFIANTPANADISKSFIRGQAAMKEMIEREKIERLQKTATASQAFMAETAHQEIAFEFRVIRENDVADQVRLHSLHADLVVVGHPRPGGLPRNWSPETMLLATGVPFLIVPDTWKGNTVASHIVVGWNASREARRAIGDSLPLLEAADDVCLVVVDADNNPSHGEETGADIALYLSRHGVKVTVDQIRSGGASAARVILDSADKLAADLIVVGGWLFRFG